MIEVVLEEVRALRREVAELRRERRVGTGKLLSAAEAARRLGVSRGKTIAVLIDEGKIRTVPVNGRLRIPASEIDRLVREGFDVTRS